MKIVRLSKDSNLTRIEKTFNWFRFSGRGPEGTIGKLTTLANKAVVIPADLALIGDSAAAFANKNSTWQQLIDTVLSLFANNISDVNATALTDGGETALHSHAGGGGGGKWSPLTTRALSGLIAELFDPVDNTVMLDFDDVQLSGSGFLQVALSVDAGVSYPATHTFEIAINRSGLASTQAVVGVSQTAFNLVSNTNNQLLNGKVVLSGITSAGQVSMDDLKIESPSATQSYMYHGGGRFFTNGVVNKIKVTTSTGVNLTSGNITLSKRNF